MQQLFDKDINEKLKMEGDESFRPFLKTKTMKTILEISSLEKSYDGLKAINELSLSIKKGEIFGLIGPNGSGKTTLFNIISGFIKPDKGEVYFQGKRITNLPAYKRPQLGVGRLFQEVRVFEKISVLDNMLLISENHAEEGILTPFLKRNSLKKEEQKNLNEAYHWLNFVDLADNESSLAENLS
ncbi:MAG: ATP-binding cassette domain-containing protein, partial [Thermodesulfobacteriota bacterium]